MCRNACVQVWPWLCVLLAFAPHLGCPFGMTCSPTHARASRHTHQASLDAYYIYFFKITDQLASLTFYFSPLACQQYHQSAISPQKKRFCTSLFDNTRDSCVTFPPPRLSPHFPCTSNPHSQPIQVFQSASHARRMGRKWAGIFCWKVLTATIKWLFDLQTIMELGLLTRCRGSFFPPFLPSAVQTHRNAINFSARPYKAIMVLFIQKEKVYFAFTEGDVRKSLQTNGLIWKGTPLSQSLYA